MRLENQHSFLIVLGAHGFNRSIETCIAVQMGGGVIGVVVGEPTSFLDAYALIKAAHLENGVRNFCVLVNMSSNDDQAQSYFEKFRETVSQFLDVSLHYVGAFPMSAKLRTSIVKRKPVSLDEANAKEILALQRIAANVIKSPVNSPDGIRFFSGEADKTEK